MKQMYEELTELFDTMLDDEDWRADLRSCSVEELSEQLRQALEVVEGFVVAAEGVNFVALLVLSDCRERAREALRLVSEHL